MLDNEGADAGKPDKAESGASAGGSSEDGSENDDKPITAKQLKAALASQKSHYERELANRDAQFDAFKAGAGTKEKPAERPKVYGKPELKAAVDGGQITQEQADDIWERQREAQITERAELVALDTVTRQATKERIDADLAAYKRLKPEILDKGSEVREQIREEFNYLVKIGKPKDEATELAAIRAVLGPLAKLEKAASATRSVEHEEQGGGQGGEPKNRGGSSKKLVDHLKGDAKKYYERAIEQRRYKDWEAVEAELKYARPSTRQRLGLPQA
jgi:hypothetical protein